MTWPGFSSLPAAWLFALLVPLIIFYFLKLRRPRMELSSLALWRQVISDQRVNSPFQRFKRNLLLLLQILLLCALTLGAMQPFWPSGADRAQAIPVLIDCSASMAALDKADGQSRLDAAKADVRKLIDSLLPSQRLSLIAVDHTARRLTDFTDNQRVLREALDRLEVQPVASRLEDGLRMAQALARTASVNSVLLYSDGNVPQQIEFELPFRLNYQKLPAGGPNLGVTEFNARRTQTGWDVFARLEGSTGMTGLVEVELLMNGQPVKRESVSITAGEKGGVNPARLSFSIEAAEAASLELRIRPDAFDSLAIDNIAYLELPSPRPLTVLCPKSLTSYRHALQAIGDLELFPREGIGDPTSVDLKFADESSSDGPPARVTVHIGVVPKEVEALLDVQSALAEVIDWNRTAPLLRHVQMLDVQIAEDPVSRQGIGERDFEQAGYEILAQSAHGPLVLEKATPTRVEYFTLFHTDRSSLPYRVGFPIFVANTVEIARERSGLSEVRSLPSGVLPPITVDPDREYQVASPGGATESVKSGTAGMLTGIGASETGRYRIRDGQTDIVSLGVSLLAPTETQLVTAEKLDFPETTVSTAREAVATDRPLWGWFAIAGLVLLLTEWWVFQKRPSGLPA